MIEKESPKEMDYRIRVQEQVLGADFPIDPSATVQVVDELDHPKLGKFTYISPDEAGLFLHFAEMYMPKAELERDQLFTHSHNINTPTGQQKAFESDEKTLRFLEYSSVFVILTYTAVEAFANARIPRNYQIQRKKLFFFQVMLDKKAIERKFSTFEKLADILPKALNKPSPKGRAEWGELEKLRKIRNKLIHLSSDSSYAATNQFQSVYNDLFLMDHKKTLKSVKTIFELLGIVKYS